MKRRAVALMLSFTMCATLVVEAGAAEMSDEAITLASEEAAAWAEEDSAELAASEEETEPEIAEPTVGEPVVEEPEITEPDENVPEEIPEEDSYAETEPEEILSDVDAFADGFMDEVEVKDEVGEESFQVFEETYQTVMLYGMSLKAYEVDEEDWETDGDNIRLVKPQPEETAEPAEETEEATEPTEEPEEETPDTAEPAEYFTAEDGLVLIRTVANGVGHEQVYLFDDQGNLITGESAEVADEQGNVSTYSFVGEEEAVLYSDYAGSNELVGPWNSNDGATKVNELEWDGTAFKYYGPDGKGVAMSETSYLTSKGYYEIAYNGGKTFRYNLNEAGVPQTGTAVLGGKEYYFDETKNASGIPGSMHFKWLYQVENGKERWRYYAASTGERYRAEVWATKLDPALKASVGTYKYLLDKDGYVLKKTVRKAANGYTFGTDANGRIYINKIASIGGTWYYFGTNGALTGNKLVKSGNYRYYFTSSGKLATWTNRWVACPGVNNRWYYFGKVAGRVEEKKGWQKITTTAGKYVGWAFFNKNGNCFQNVSTQDYYFNEKGLLASGLTKIGSKYYFFTASSSSVHRGIMMKGALISYNGKMYLASRSGVLYRNMWGKFKGNYYYFQSDCDAVRQKYMNHDGTWGYCDKAGKFTTGWYVISSSKNLVRYLNPNAKGYYKNTTAVIDGKQYRFDSNGYRVNDRSAEIKLSKYHLEVDKGNGVMTVYTDKTLKIPVRSMRISVGLPSTPTPNGNFTVHRSLRWQPLMGPSWGQYGSHVVSGIYIHSVAGSAQSSYSLPAGEYDKLGVPASHGCIRVCVADAKWVFENCDGSSIHIYTGNYIQDDALKGPLGKPPFIPRRGSGNFDPTDPAVN